MIPSLALALLLGPKPTPAKIADVLKTPARYDGKALAVKGVVADYKAKKSKAGRDYVVFDLVENGKSLAVYLSNKLEPGFKDGDKVTVVGKYAKERKVGERTYQNELDASTRLDKAFGVKKA